MGRVLLTNGQLRKTLAAARSLGEKGIEVLVADETRFTPAAFSKYCSKSLVYPSPAKSPERFYQWLINTVKEHNCDVVFPMDDDIIEIVMEHREELESLCRLPLASSEGYRIASDKGEAVKFAMKRNVKCPETFFPSSFEELTDTSAEMKYPVLLKPRKSSGARGIRIINDRHSLLSEYKEIHKKYPYPFIQEYMEPGPLFDVLLLYNSKSQLRGSFIQKIIRKYPIEVGPSTMQESVKYPQLLDMAVELMDKLEWQGLADLEFMIDKRDGRLKFIEINPRFWNSLYISILAGVDFPWLTYKMLMDGDVEGVFDYKTGIKCRNMLPGELLHFLANKSRFKMSPPLFSGKRKGVFDDIMSFKDPMPTLGFFMACGRYLFDIDMWRLMFKR